MKTLWTNPWVFLLTLIWIITGILAYVQHDPSILGFAIGASVIAGLGVLLSNFYDQL